MKWHDILIGGLLAFLVVVICLPLIIFIEWSEIMDKAKEKARQRANKHQGVDDG